MACCTQRWWYDKVFLCLEPGDWHETVPVTFWCCCVRRVNKAWVQLWHFLFPFLVVLAYFIVGILLLQDCFTADANGKKVSDWGLTTKVYFLAQTATTVGYGDQTCAGVGSFSKLIIVLMVGMLCGIALSFLATQTDNRFHCLKHWFCCGDRVYDSVDVVAPPNLNLPAGKKVAIFIRDVMTPPRLVWVLIVFVGAAIHEQIETDTSENYMDSLYWSMTTLTTVGYGDHSTDQNEANQWFGVIFMMVGVPLTAWVFIDFGNWIFGRKRKWDLRKKVQDFQEEQRPIRLMNYREFVEKILIPKAADSLGLTEHYLSDFDVLMRQPGGGVPLLVGAAAFAAAQQQQQAAAAVQQQQQAAAAALLPAPAARLQNPAGPAQAARGGVEMQNPAPREVWG